MKKEENTGTKFRKTEDNSKNVVGQLSLAPVLPMGSPSKPVSKYLAHFKQCQTQVGISKIHDKIEVKQDPEKPNLTVYSQNKPS